MSNVQHGAICARAAQKQNLNKKQKKEEKEKKRASEESAG